MQRRDFFRVCAAAGLGLAVPVGRTHADEPYEGRFLVVLLCAGGWDPTMVADPRGAVNRTFGEGDIRTAGNIRYAPLAGAQRFFERHYRQMVVVNGINFATGSHEAGVRYCSSGHLGPGHPTLAALYAGSVAPELPLAFLTFGGYENDEGIVPAIRSFNVHILGDVERPDHYIGRERYTSEPVEALIREARDARLLTRARVTGLPRYRRSAESVLAVRSGMASIGRLRAEIPELAAETHRQEVQIGIAAFKAGIGVALNVTNVGGGQFDSHRDHDVDHTAAIVNMYNHLDFIWSEAERQGIADRLDIVITSDFGRTPYYDPVETGNGKGHWPIGSMMVVSGRIARPNRVVGSTDEGLHAIPVDPATLAPSPSGVELTPEIVHQNIRELLGIADSEASRRFPLRPTADLALF